MLDDEDCNHSRGNKLRASNERNSSRCFSVGKFHFQANQMIVAVKKKFEDDQIQLSYTWVDFSRAIRISRKAELE